MVNLFILGVALLAGFVLIARWYVGVDVQALKKALMWAGLGLAMVALMWLGLTGKLWAALAALPAVFMWFLRLFTGLRYAQMFKRMMGGLGGGGGWSTPGAGGGGAGKTSNVRTRFVDMTLDHDSGALTGRVLDGRFQGRDLDDLSLEDVLDLLDEARADPDSARVLESYLDRRAPDWRDRQKQSGGGRSDAGDGSGGRAGTNAGAMTRAEALRVLGLDDGADRAAIKAAHRRLMAQVHPDHGGSDYLAQQINQAKDVLLR